MPNSTTAISDLGYLDNELACYLHTDVLEIVLPNMQAMKDNYDAEYDARHYGYQLPLGNLRLLELVVYLPNSIASADIETIRKTAIKSALAWHEIYLSNHKHSHSVTAQVLVFDIQFKSNINNNSLNNKNTQNDRVKRMKHSFTARYFMEDLIVDMSNVQQLQVFSWHDWQAVLAALHTPCELWRFLQYRLNQLQRNDISHLLNIDAEALSVSQFLNSSALFAPAIAVDNELIKYGLQNEPNSALIAMTLAQKTNSATTQMYQQHMKQAAVLWSQLSSQMIAMVSKKPIAAKSKEPPAEQQKKSLGLDFFHWQQQILDESLFSRHELIRTLYKHPKQEMALQKQGYVIHQHSYECLGRHYVLIFYGQDLEGQNSKARIQPNLAKIALDVATRLPIAELHHVIVLGIDFIEEAGDTFIDIDLWIQPVEKMTQRERQLTKQLQQLQQKNQN